MIVPAGALHRQKAVDDAFRVADGDRLLPGRRSHDGQRRRQGGRARRWSEQCHCTFTVPIMPG